MSIPSQTLLKAVPVLPAKNLNQTIQFYRDRLQFDATHYGDHLAVHVHGIAIHFVESTVPSGFQGAACCIYVRNIEDMYAYFSARDIIQPVQGLKDTWRRTKEFSITDNNGNKIRFLEKKD